MTQKHYLEAELEQRLRDDPQVWEFIRRSSLDGVWYWDLEKPEHEWMSPEFWETFGYDPTDKPHRADAWQDIIDADDLELAKRNVAAHIADPDFAYDQVVRYRNAEGSTTWVRCRGLAIRNEKGEAIRLLGAHTDLTELINAAREREAAFQVSNNRLNAVLDAAQSGIVGLDARGRVTFVNPKARHMLGGLQDEAPFDWPDNISFLEVVGLRALRGSEDPVRRSLSGTQLSGEIFAMMRRSNDEPRYLRVTSAVVDVEDETDVGVVLVLDDISDQERNRQKIERSSRLDALGQLTGGIAHDFNNLLATIEYAVQLSMDQQDPEKAATYLRTALGSVRRGADLTKRLLAFAKSQPGLARSWEVDELIARFAELVGPTIEAHITLRFDVAEPDLWVFCDRSQLDNALLNLVLNCRDAIMRSGDGDEIQVQVRNVTNPVTPEHDTAEEVSAFASRFVEFAVSDNGPGMSAEVKSRAIDPFFTTKESNTGTGLGLSMVYGFVQQSKGDLRIYSETGHGTTVRILLPRGTPEGAREEPVARRIAKGGDGSHILLAEDEVRLLKIMTDVIENLGYRVTTVRSGAEALAAVEDGLQFDLLLTDVVMPGPIGGFELARRVKEARPGIPVLYMSGYTGFSEAEMGEVVAPLIQKPCPPDDLAVALRTAIDGGEA